MPLPYKRITKEEADSVGILAKGQYQFKVISCSEEMSKNSGSVYLKLKLELYLPQKSITWYDNITMHEAFAWKLRHACEEMGLLDKYDAGTLEDNDFELKGGTLIIDHRINKNNGSSESYVKDYGVRVGDRQSGRPGAQAVNGKLPQEYNVYEALSSPKRPHASLNSAPLSSQRMATEFADDDIPF